LIIFVFLQMTLELFVAENEGQQWELVFIYLLVLILCNYSRFKYLGILVVKLGF